jgi:hypothetical protein
MLPVPKSLLPAQFHDLEQWLAWSLATEPERSAKRQASTMDDLKAFYHALLARMEEVLPYLDQFSLDALPEDATRLFYLTLSLAEVAPAVEQFGQPSVVDGYDVKRVVTQHTEAVTT